MRANFLSVKKPLYFYNLLLMTLLQHATQVTHKSLGLSPGSGLMNIKARAASLEKPTTWPGSGPAFQGGLGWA